MDLQNIREIRKSRSLNQHDLGMRVGTSQTIISLIERGYLVPNPEEKQKIAEALGVSTTEIDWNTAHEKRLSKNQACSHICRCM